VFDDLLDIFDRDRPRGQRRGGLRGLLDRFSENDDDRTRHSSRDPEDGAPHDRRDPHRRRDALEWDD
jgi:hypothetical protein